MLRGVDVHVAIAAQPQRCDRVARDAADERLGHGLELLPLLLRSVEAAQRLRELRPAHLLGALGERRDRRHHSQMSLPLDEARRLFVDQGLHSLDLAGAGLRVGRVDNLEVVAVAVGHARDGGDRRSGGARNGDVDDQHPAALTTRKRGLDVIETEQRLGRARGREHDDGGGELCAERGKRGSAATELSRKRLGPFMGAVADDDGVDAKVNEGGGGQPSGLAGADHEHARPAPGRPTNRAPGARRSRIPRAHGARWRSSPEHGGRRRSRCERAARGRRRQRQRPRSRRTRCAPGRESPTRRAPSSRCRLRHRRGGARAQRRGAGASSARPAAGRRRSPRTGTRAGRRPQGHPIRRARGGCRSRRSRPRRSAVRSHSAAHVRSRSRASTRTSASRSPSATASSLKNSSRRSRSQRASAGLLPPVEAAIAIFPRFASGGRMKSQFARSSAALTQIPSARASAGPARSRRDRRWRP